MINVYNPVKNFVKDYWDLGVTVLGGYLLTSHGADAAAGACLFLSGSVLGTQLGPKNERISRETRNIFSGITGMLFGAGTTTSQLFGIGMTYLTAASDRARADAKPTNKKTIEGFLIEEFFRK